MGKVTMELEAFEELSNNSTYKKKWDKLKRYYKRFPIMRIRSKDVIEKMEEIEKERGD
jgi:hypothetical protein